MPQMYDESVDESAEGVLPTFYHKKVLNKDGTETEDQEWIIMRVRGDHTLEVDRKVEDRDRRRFSESYDKFKKGLEQKFGDGTPLEDWPGCDNSLIKILNGQDVYTVEQLAEYPDNFIYRVRGGQTWKQKAIKWLEARHDPTDLRGEVDDLKATVQALMEENMRLKEKPRKKTTTKKSATTED